MGSKWAHSTCLCTPNSPKESLEKHILDPFLANLWSQKCPFSRHFVTLDSTWAHFTCLCTPNGLGSFSGKSIFDLFWTHCLSIFWSQNNPFSRHFVTLARQKWLATGSKWAHFTCSPQMAWNRFWKNTFFTHFLSQNTPFSRHFVTLEWPKWLAMGSKWAQFTCLGRPNGLESFLEKHIFSPIFCRKMTHFQCIL